MKELGYADYVRALREDPQRRVAVERRLRAPESPR